MTVRRGLATGLAALALGGAGGAAAEPAEATPVAPAPERTTDDPELQRARRLSLLAEELAPDLAFASDLRETGHWARAGSVVALGAGALVAADRLGARHPATLAAAGVSAALAAELAVEWAVSPADVGCARAWSERPRAPGDELARVLSFERCASAEAERARRARQAQLATDVAAAALTAGFWASAGREERDLRSLFVPAGLLVLAGARWLSSPEERIASRYERTRGPPLGGTPQGALPPLDARAGQPATLR